MQGEALRVQASKMQVQDQEKRRKIMAAAGTLFAKRPFHKVCLNDVAREAGVGKGTVYTYFASKDDLYVSLLEDALGQLVELIERELAGCERTTAESLRLIVHGLVDYAADHPYLFELLRSGAMPLDRPQWTEKRAALTRMIERVLRRGVQRGEVDDPHPELAALYIPGLVRSAMLHHALGGERVDRQCLGEHILRFVKTGLLTKEAS